MDLNTIVNILLFFVFPWFLPLLVALCAYWYKRLIASLPPAQRVEAVRLTQMGVAWAEQTLGDAPGSAKRNEAITMITQALAAAKITVSPHLIDMALEEAVKAMNTPPVAVVAPVQASLPPPLPLPPAGGVPPKPGPQPIILTVPPSTTAAGQQH